MTYHPTSKVTSQDNNTICVSYPSLTYPCYRGGLETVDPQHIDSESFPSQHGTLTKCWFNVGQRRRRWANIKTALG